jgi:hypothetical protein
MKYLLISLLLLGCVEMEPAPTDQPTAGSVGVNTQAFTCKKVITTDVFQKIGVLCAVVQVPPESSWGQTLYTMTCSEPVYFGNQSLPEVTTGTGGVRYSTPKQVWQYYAPRFSNRSSVETRYPGLQVKRSVSTLFCDVVIPPWVQ